MARKIGIVIPKNKPKLVFFFLDEDEDAIPRLLLIVGIVCDELWQGFPGVQRSGLPVTLHAKYVRSILLLELISKFQ